MPHDAAPHDAAPHDEVQRRLEAAKAAIGDAGEAALDFFARRHELSVTRKGAQDLVSEADRHVETLITDRLSAAFPDDGFVGEEGGARNAEADALWIIDPIDGTHNFLTGVPFWSVSLGLLVAGEPVLGLVLHPPAGELFHAARGSGAWLNDAPMKVSGETDIARARIGVGFSYRRPVGEHVRALEALLAAGCEYSRLGSGALGLAYAAAGRFDGYWERHINAWDVAGGLVLMREAGGCTSDFFAAESLTTGGEVLAATPDLVEPLKRFTGFGVP